MTAGNLPGLFVTGTGTGVGKSVLSATLAAGLRHRGVDARALKPVLSGLAETPDPVWGHDHTLLARAGGRPAPEVAGFAFDPPVSPHLAAELAGHPLDLESILAWVSCASQGADAVIVEGVGGLLVPLSDRADVADLAVALGLPVVIAASPGLGTINHSLLTLECARRRGLDVLAVVLSGWPASPSVMELSNRETIARLGETEVLSIPRIDAPIPAALARAAEALPLARWLERPSPERAEEQLASAR